MSADGGGVNDVVDTPPAPARATDHHHQQQQQQPAPSPRKQDDDDAELTDKDIEERDSRPFFFRHVTAIVKICSLLLIAGMWVCTVFLVRNPKDNDFSPWYCLGVSIGVTLLELVWFFSRCAFCKDDGGCCCTCWRILMWLDNWKKGFLYIALAVPPFINLTLLAVICGTLLMVLGVLYVVKSIADCPCVGGKKYVRRQCRQQQQQQDEDDETRRLGDVEKTAR